MITDGESLHYNIKDAVQCISCTTIKPNNMIHINCALSICDECSKFITTGKELNDVPNSQLIHFGVYTYQGKCENMVSFKIDQLYANYAKKKMT